MACHYVALAKYGSPGWIRTSDLILTDSPLVTKRSGLSHHPEGCQVYSLYTFTLP